MTASPTPYTVQHEQHGSHVLDADGLRIAWCAKVISSGVRGIRRVTLDQAQANATLFAAAPRLAQSVRELISWLEPAGEREPLPDEAAMAIASARLVLAEAMPQERAK